MQQETGTDGDVIHEESKAIATTLVGVFDSEADTQSAFDQLGSLGLGPDEMSSEQVLADPSPVPQSDVVGASEVAGGAAVGAVFGGLLGALVGWMLAAGAILLLESLFAGAFCCSRSKSA